MKLVMSICALFFVISCKEKSIIGRFEEFIKGHTVGIEGPHGIAKIHFASDGTQYLFPPSLSKDVNDCFAGTWEIREGQLCSKFYSYQLVGDFLGENSVWKRGKLGDENCKTVMESSDTFIFEDGSKLAWRSDEPYMCKY